MTRTDKLLDIGLRCPCGGKVYHRYELNGWEESLYCTNCVDIRYRYRIGGWTTEKKVAMLTDWFVLTGGPIPGEIHPPNDLECPGTSICVLSKGHLIYWESKPSRWIHIPSNWPTNDPDEGWYFLDRNPEIIRPWLEEEIDE